MNSRQTRISACIETHYWPCLEYLCALWPVHTIHLEQHEYYIKQTYRNRCYVQTAAGVQYLVVPIRKHKNKTPIQEVQIDYTQKWQNQHWRTLESAYRKSPYYEYYADQIKDIIYATYDSLFALNYRIMHFVISSLKSTHIKTLQTSSSYQACRDIDIRHQIGNTLFSSRTYYQPVSYYQVFGSAFSPNLSCLDILFCEGIYAEKIIQRSCLNPYLKRNVLVKSD